MRDYGIPGQIGAEMGLDEYLARLVTVFREVRRVLRDDGTLWLNIGDSSTSGGRTWRETDRKNPARAMAYRPPTPPGLKPKDLIGVPWRLAFALQQDGWYLRADIVWNKPNCQPESVKWRGLGEEGGDAVVHGRKPIPLYPSLVSPGPLVARSRGVWCASTAEDQRAPGGSRPPGGDPDRSRFSTPVWRCAGGRRPFGPRRATGRNAASFEI